MGRFLINVTLSNKDEVQCRVEARNQKEAIDKLMNVQEFINFVGDKEIKKYEISIDSEKTEKTDDRFLLQNATIMREFGEFLSKNHKDLI